GASPLSIPPFRRVLRGPRRRRALPQREPGQDLAAVLLAVHGHHEHTLIEGAWPKPRAGGCQQFRAVRERELGSRFVDALYLTHNHPLFSLGRSLLALRRSLLARVAFRLSESQCWGEADRDD